MALDRRGNGLDCTTTDPATKQSPRRIASSAEAMAKAAEQEIRTRDMSAAKRGCTLEGAMRLPAEYRLDDDTKD